MKLLNETCCVESITASTYLHILVTFTHKCIICLEQHWNVKIGVTLGASRHFNGWRPTSWKSYAIILAHELFTLRTDGGSTGKEPVGFTFQDLARRAGLSGGMLTFD